MRQLPNRFHQISFDETELEVAKAVTPYTWAFIQNKLAEYALAVVEFEYSPNFSQDQQILGHERLKAQVMVLEELLRELTVPIDSTETQT